MKFIILLILLTQFSNAQIVFEDRTNIMEALFAWPPNQPKYDSGSAIGIFDLNNDNRDDIVLMTHKEACGDSMDLQIFYQKATLWPFHPFYTGGLFAKDQNVLPIGDSKAMVIANDLFGNDDSYVISGGARNKLYLHNISQQSSTELNVGYFYKFFWLQGCNFYDFENDGDLDLFAGNDIHMSVDFDNNGTNLSSASSHIIAKATRLECSRNVDEQFFHDPNSGNYGTVFADIDFDPNGTSNSAELYISKCRGGIPAAPHQGCTVNQLFAKNQQGIYGTDIAPQYGLDDFTQSWAADFADIDNDGDLDVAILNHYESPNVRILENVGINQPFVDITQSSNVQYYPNGGLQILFEDFDNDGWLDLLVSSRNGCELYKNNGATSLRTFTKVNNWLSSSSLSHAGIVQNFKSFSTGHLNNDDFIDLYVEYSNNNDILFLNQGNGNQVVKVKLVGNQSNKNGVGARIHLEHPILGTQVREIRAGESYGIVTSMIQSFGIENHPLSEFSLSVFWPSGTIDLINPISNNFIQVDEGCCP